MLGHRVDRFDETHRLTDPARPVRRHAVFAAAALAGHRAEERHRFGARLQVSQPLLHRVGRRLHHGMVEGMADPHETGEHAGCFQLGRHFLERGLQSGKGERTRTVERRDADFRIVAGDEFFRLRLGKTDGEHAAFAVGAILHRLRAHHDDLRGFLQREDTREASRGDFAHAVTDDARGFDAPRFPKFSQRDLHGKDGGLREFGLSEARLVLVAGQFLEEREARVRCHGRGAAFHRFAEHRLGAYEFASHAPPLRTLSAHDETDARGMFRRRREGGLQLGARAILRESQQGVGQLTVGFRGAGQAVRMMVAPRAERVDEIRQQGRCAVGLQLRVDPSAEILRGYLQ